MTSSSPSARLRPFRPQPFGRYTLLSHLATGGMGEIYLARLEGAQGFEKLCVIKKILPQLAADKEFVDRFVGEARTLVKLSHGSIAQVLDMGVHEGDAYMALEYVDGKDLRKVAGRVRDRQMPLPLTFVLFVMGRVLDALAYAHRKRDDDEKEILLVHRDVSPQNILISYEGEVKVIDFGLAKSRLSAAKTNPSIILGKFLYMSPEQARHQPVDRRSDLYAVGLCLYELLSGKNPFDSVLSGELMSAVANPRIPHLSEVEPLTPPAVAQIVMKALAVDPAQRFQTAEEFRGQLMGCLMEIDRSAGPESISRFMRDLFATEYQGERKLLGQLKDASRLAEPAPRVDVATDPATRLPNPQLPPRTIKLDGPAAPLSFQPTPRSREGAPVHEGETRPGVAVEEPARPAASFEALDAAARARVRPSPASLAGSSPETETVSVELRLEAPERPGPPVPAASPEPLHASSMSPTLEMPIPIVPPDAIPPGYTPQAPASAPAARAVEPPRPAPPPAPAAGAPGLSRPAAPPAPPVPLPPPLSPSLPQEPRGALPTTPELPRVSIPASEPPVPPREPPRVAAARAALADAEGASARPTEPLDALPLEKGVGPADPSRRGLDDTHPSYLMAPGAARERDTQPRVVLDAAAFSEQEIVEGQEQIIVSNVLEEPGSSPGRPRLPPRRGRGSSAGMPALSRGPAMAARSGARPVEPALDDAEPSEPSLPSVEVEAEQVARDPREDTRRTSIPSRPDESTRRVHRDDTRRPRTDSASGGRSWAWIAITVVMLGMAGGAVAVTYPYLKHLMPWEQEPRSGPPPALPIEDPAEAMRKAALAAAGEGGPSPATASPPAPGGDSGPAAEAAPASETASPAAAEDDGFVVPLTPGATPTAKKLSPPSRSSRKSARKDNELQKEWSLTSRAFSRLTGVQSCDSPKIGLLCSRYMDLQSDVDQAGDSADRELINKVRKLRKDIQAQAGAAP
jgi:eukaryotic-like serine/threonine-protein kinase